MLIVIGKKIRITVREQHKEISTNYLKKRHIIMCFGKTVSVFGTTKMSVPNIKMIEKINTGEERNIYVELGSYHPQKRLTLKHGVSFFQSSNCNGLVCFGLEDG